MDAPHRPPRDGRAKQIVAVAPLGLIILAEAAWISVIGGLIQEFVLRRAELGLPAIAAFVAAGVIAGAVLGPRLGSRWPFVAVGLVAAAAALGWALSDDARAAVGGGLGPALATHPGGLIAGLAVLRGLAHPRVPLSEDTVGTLLALGIPGLAGAALLGGLIAEPLRSTFLGEALGASIVFVGSAALALALTRLDAIGADGGFDWRRNPIWVVVAVAALVGAIVLSLPLAAVAGTILSVVVSVTVLPLLIVGLATGLDPTSRRILAGMALIVAVILVLTRMFGPPQSGQQPGIGVGAGGSGSATAAQVMSIGVGGILLLLAVLTVVILVALWMRRQRPADDTVDEDRTIDPSGDPLDPGRRRTRFGRRAGPRTAVEAYLALVDDLDGRADVRRDAAETPAAHAARLRPSGRAGLALDLLAADYALGRYGGVELSATEDLRGIRRWRSLRRRLRGGLGVTPGVTAAELVVPRTDLETEGTRTGTRPM